MRKHLFLFLVSLLTVSLAVKAQAKAEKQIIEVMDKAAAQWNKGDLDGYMSLYDTTASMMMPAGRQKLNGVRQLYEKYYFEAGKPKQQLSYDTYEFTPLGKDYALLTGRFILKASEKMKERTGTFSLVFIRRGKIWKILHDHSG